MAFKKRTETLFTFTKGLLGLFSRFYFLSQPFIGGLERRGPLGDYGLQAFIHFLKLGFSLTVFCIIHCGPHYPVPLPRVKMPTCRASLLFQWQPAPAGLGPGKMALLSIDWISCVRLLNSETITMHDALADASIIIRHSFPVIDIEARLFFPGIHISR